MANFQGSIYSESLQMRTNLTVVTPQNILASSEPYKVVYLLHGLSDSCHDWNENTQLTLLANDYNIVFIMPEVQRSFYTDMKYGLQYFTYVTDELPKICQTLFPVSAKREDNFVMGLSMGGYGAIKCALSRPNQYAGGASFSGALMLTDVMKRVKEEGDEQRYREMQSAFGLEFEDVSQNDLCVIAKECEKNALRPDLFITCGTEDFIYNESVDFCKFMKDVDIPLTYQEWSGVHEWYLWNKSLHLACAHFFKRVNPENYCNIQ